MILSGPMFESAKSDLWRSMHDKQGAHYNVYAAENEETMAMEALRQMFPEAEANEMNFCLFSTSGIHGMYTTIEEVESWVIKGEAYEDEEDGPEEVTFLIVQPRLVCLRYGNCYPKTEDDFAFLKKLRRTSWDAVEKIGR